MHDGYDEVLGHGAAQLAVQETARCSSLSDLPQADYDDVLHAICKCMLERQHL